MMMKCNYCEEEIYRQKRDGEIIVYECVCGHMNMEFAPLDIVDKNSEEE